MKKLFSTNAFSRNGYSSISERAFFPTIAVFTLYGLFLTFLGSLFAPASLSIFPLLGLFVVSMVGAFVSMNESLPISFIGYNMIVLPFGLIVGSYVNHFAPNVVFDAAVITAIITGLMGFAGIVYPNLFKSLGGVLFYSLLGLIFVRILAMFIPALNSFGIIDYISAGIFSLYIGFDMYRASVATRTVTSALHIAVALYLDIVNLFMSILSIAGDD
jgi:FtsH-binding integral membrane protein